MISTIIVYAIYKRQMLSDKGACHPFDSHLVKFSENRTIFNFTSENSNMTWYCIAPRKKGLGCKDWTSMKHGHPSPVPLTKVELDSIENSRKNISTPIKIAVSGKSGVFVEKQAMPCKLVERKLLWNMRTPTGFFYQNKWFLRHCQGVSEAQQRKCLTNRRVYLLGDSTNRQWFYETIMPRFNCTLVTEKWTTPKWHRPSICKSPSLNLTVSWIPHCQPFLVGTDPDDKKYSTVSMEKRLDDIGSEENAFVVICLYLHMNPYQPDVFRSKIKRIKQGVERLLTRNSLAQVFIKAPHTYTKTSSGDLRLSDWFAYVNANILYEEFIGLHDKVIFLNQMDSTDAKLIQLNHPPTDIVGFMVDQMLGYVC